MGKKNVGVVLAGGIGARVGLGLPKQLIKIAGKEIIDHTLGVLETHPGIDEIIVMMTPGFLDDVRRMVRNSGYTKVTKILEGGATRNETTKLALAAVEDDESRLILHDAVRPLLSPQVVDRVLAALDEHDAVDVAIPSPDTIIEVTATDGVERIVDVPDRSRLRRGQTPQAFRKSTLAAAYERADQDPQFAATDDCSVVLRYTPEVPIAVVAGEEWNMKVTEPIDIFLSEKLFQLRSDSRRANLTDEQLRAGLDGRVLVVFGGSYGIGKAICKLARSYGCTVKSFSRSETNTHVQRRSDLAAARDEVLLKHDRIDFVVNTSGILNVGPLSETTEEEVYAATEVNYTAPVFIAQEFQEPLAQTRGSLLLFTSSSYTRGRAGYALYSSAKAATVNLTQALADEWSELGVRVNCVNPQRTATPMRTAAFGEEDPASLLTAGQVATAALETLLSNRTGDVVDVRQQDPTATAAAIMSVMQGE
ncbi:SDR family NAD(P)-dependent oxidoreductase [Flexivirga sp. B27]